MERLSFQRRTFSLAEAFPLFNFSSTLAVALEAFSLAVTAMFLTARIVTHFRSKLSTTLQQALLLSIEALHTTLQQAFTDKVTDKECKRLHNTNESTNSNSNLSELFWRTRGLVGLLIRSNSSYTLNLPNLVSIYFYSVSR